MTASNVAGRSNDIVLGDDPAEVRNLVLVGTAENPIVISGPVVVENDVVIAAGALVTPGKTLRSGYLYAGSPARERRELSQ